MNCKIARTVLAVVFTASVIVTARAHAWEQCSLAGAAGRWSFTDNGTIVGVGPRTAVGVFSLDKAGNLQNAQATASLNGTVAHETLSGTITVKPNCTGTGSATIRSGGIEILAVTLNLSFDDSMNELRAIFSSATLPDGTPVPAVISLQARKQ
jgi:hypothetical protein